MLARILSPSDFGTIAACLIFTEVGSTIVSSSYVSGLIQRREVSRLDLSTVFILQLITAVAVALLIIGLAPVAAHVLNHKMVIPILSVLSINLIILAFCSVPTALARRNLDFKILTYAGVTELIFNGVVAIGMAISGFGVWSLVFGKLVGRLSYTFLLLFSTDWQPSFKFSSESAKSLLKISAQFAGKDILDDITKNIDYFIVGKLLGMSQLGFYSRAYHLMTLPVTKLSHSLGHVLFPAFSKIQDNREQLVKGLMKSSCLISLTTFPVLICLLLVAPYLISILYGPKWIPTIVPLQIICLAGLFYTIDAPAVSLIDAKGFLFDEIKRQLFHLILLVMGVIIGAQGGLAGVTWGVTGSAFIYWILLLRLLKRKINISIITYFESLLPATLSCLAMAAMVLGFQKVVTHVFALNPVFILIGSLGISGLTYFISLWVIRKILDRPLINEAFIEVDSFLHKIWQSILKVLNITVKRKSISN